MKQNKYFRLIILLLLSFGAVAFLFYWQNQKINQQATLIINQAIIRVDLMTTPQQWAQGLSNQKKLANDQGMLFVFPDYEIRSFWMKNMHFPIDIIWIADNMVVGFNENLLPEGSNPSKTYQSPIPVNYVLEVPAGFIYQYDIKINDVVQLKNY